MAHSQNKILLIVEGEKTEPKLFSQLEKVKWNQSCELQIVDIRTNIYSLYQAIKNLNEGFIDDSTSTIEVLRQILKDNNRLEEAEKLEDKYPYIYLFFDLEIQDNHYLDKKTILEEMMKYFYDETENGLLLINYPMMESYRDYKEPLIDPNFKNLFISIEDVLNKKYKSIVNERGTNKNFSKYTAEEFELLFLQNLLKANFLITNEYAAPSYDFFVEIVTGKFILDTQFDFIDKENKIAVLCTCLFVFVYYFGKDYYNKLIKFL
ncbi:MAG: hypothetical protein NC087_06395 [Anaeroplasma bactoclasticum]|nr:hypothetical protein [Anaeroplasma bactoclasticum]